MLWSTRIGTFSHASVRTSPSSLQVHTGRLVFFSPHIAPWALLGAQRSQHRWYPQLKYQYLKLITRTAHVFAGLRGWRGTILQPAKNIVEECSKVLLLHVSLLTASLFGLQPHVNPGEPPSPLRYACQVFQLWNLLIWQHGDGSSWV